MEWKIVTIDDAQDINEHGRLSRYKLVRFTVNGGKHTLKISMPDFDKGKARALVEKEAKKISVIYGEK